MKRVGIDPGKDGALTLMDDGTILESVVMPIITSTKAKKLFDLVSVRDLLKRWAPETVVIEKQQPLPVKLGGGQANYSRGYALAMLEMVSVCLGLRYVLVAPRSWQCEILRDVNTTDTKQAALVIAKRTWPDRNWLASERSRKPHDGLVDSALIGLFGWRRNL